MKWHHILLVIVVIVIIFSMLVWSFFDEPAPDIDQASPQVQLSED